MSSSLTVFVTKHKQAVIITAVALAAATSGIGAYYYLNNQPSTKGPNVKIANEAKQSEVDGGGETSGEKSDKKLASSSKSKKKKKTKAGTTVGGFSLTRDSDNSPEYPVIPDFSVVKTLKKDQAKELAVMFKDAGNHAFNKQKDYGRAIELYTSAINCDETDPIFYSNRAACYNALKKYENVIEDTTKALAIKSDYVKCLSRRAVAYEQLENYSEAILDFTSTCILGDFQDKSLNNAVDRVLRLQSEKLSKDKYGDMARKLPSPTFISAYLGSFTEFELPQEINNAQEDTGDYQLKLAFDAINRQTGESYEQSIELINKAIEQNTSALGLALEYRGTFKFLVNDIEGALEDIEKSIDLHPTVQAYIKRSSIHMERGAISSANLDFEEAIKLNPNSSDIYYHRAQVAFLTQDFNSAVKDYERSISLNDKFLFSRIQLAVTQYRQSSIQTAIDAFKNLLETFPHSSDVHNYFGEILLDQGAIDEAIKEFDYAINLEQNKKTGAINILPLINKSLAVFHKSQDINTAEALCRKASTIDPLSDVAIGTLAQFCLQQNKTEEALNLFLKSAEIARTEAERIQALSYSEAARTQLRIINERPALRQRLEAVSLAARMQ